MTTIVTKKNSQAYAIYVNGRKIVECIDPVTSANDLVKNLGIDTTEVQVVEMLSFPSAFTGGTQPANSIVQNILQDVIADKTGDKNIEDIINTVNAGMSIKGTGRHSRNDFEDVAEENDTFKSDEIHDNVETKNIDNTVPVGNIEVPGLGNLVYVDGFDGFLRKIAGGIGTVHMIFDEDTKKEVKPGNYVNSVLVELEEVPGVYFSWNGLKNKQIELKNKYGYKPVCAVK